MSWASCTLSNCHVLPTLAQVISTGNVMLPRRSSVASTLGVSGVAKSRNANDSVDRKRSKLRSVVFTRFG